MPKTFASTVLTILLLLATGATMYALSQNPLPDQSVPGSPDNAVSSPPQTTPTSHDYDTQPPTGQPITATGTVVCLTPKDTSGPQNLSCAIGLQQADGTSYALGSEDPTLTGSLPTGQRVEVVGLLTERQSSYDAAGLIQVASVRPL